MDKATQRELLLRLERDAGFLCSEFGLRYRVLEAERANVKRRYGVCFSDGTIRIRLRHASTGRALKYSSLVNTLCHELAHLRHFNHGPHFQALYARILEVARRAGIYCPTPGGFTGGMTRPDAQRERIRLLAATSPPRSVRPTPQASASERPVACQLELFG